MKDSRIEIGKSYLYIQRNRDLWSEFFDQLVEDFAISPSDVLEFDPGLEKSGVELLRKVLSSLNIKPHSSSCRVLKIVSGDLLNQDQANALLKTIEEPPSYGLVLVFASNVSRVLPTIRSRCIRIHGFSEIESGNSDFLDFLDLDFNQFLVKTKNIESNEIPDMLNLSLQQIKRRGINAENVALYQKIAGTLMRLSSSGANARLALEEIYVWLKADREK